MSFRNTTFTKLVSLATNTITDLIDQLTNIRTLIPDIRRLLASRGEIDIPMIIHFGERKEKPTLRLSKMGPICPKHLWHSIHTPDLAEALPPEAIFKFSYGHTIETMAIALAKEAGHEVTGEQDELVVAGIKGHRDCVLDGYIVDVKSCSSRMFEKFVKKTIATDDPFGYLDQLDGYMVGSVEDDLVRVKDVAFIWAIDKTLGKMVLYEHRLREDSIRSRIEDHKRVVSSPQPPDCTCGIVADGKSGNYKLDVKASYSPFKYVCQPRTRTFLYSDGPRYLTTVARRPAIDIIELDKSGRRVYNYS